MTGKHSALLYKEEIEVILRTPGLAGFQLLDLHDYPGTGTALIGLLDVFRDSKGIISPNEFRQFCGETVPLLRMTKREYTTDKSFDATVEILHFGPFPHEIVIDMGQEINLAGAWLLPRQDGNSNGWFERGEFYVGNAPTAWGEPVARAQFPGNINKKRITFDKPHVGRYIRFIENGGVGGNPWAAIAELDVVRISDELV